MAPFVFPLGESTLQLEVSDGALTANDTMILTLTNSAPTADAGGNVMIDTSSLASTVLQGVANDTDGDAVLFRWLDISGGGATELQGFTAPGSLGEAVLELSLQPQLGIGEHNLRIEVSDGFEQVHDDLVLTIGNSPPTAALVGGGTFNLGSVIFIGGSIGDFDGDGSHGISRTRWDRSLPDSYKPLPGGIRLTCRT